MKLKCLFVKGGAYLVIKLLVVKWTINLHVTEIKKLQLSNIFWRPGEGHGKPLDAGINGSVIVANFWAIFNNRRLSTEMIMIIEHLTHEVCLGFYCFYKN